MHAGDATSTPSHVSTLIHTCSHFCTPYVQGVGSKQSLMDFNLMLEMPQQWDEEACVWEPHLSPDAALVSGRGGEVGGGGHAV